MFSQKVDKEDNLRLTNNIGLQINLHTPIHAKTSKIIVIITSFHKLYDYGPLFTDNLLFHQVKKSRLQNPLLRYGPMSVTKRNFEQERSITNCTTVVRTA